MISPDELEDAISKIGNELRILTPGPLAELRRMESGGPGTPTFWQLMARCKLGVEQTREWQQIIRIMAILTPKGERTSDQPIWIHGRYPFGRALCDGGNPDWKPSSSNEPRGVLSEERLNRFLVMPQAGRADALERMARMLIRTRDVSKGINCVEIASLILTSNNVKTLHKIAYDYFERLSATIKKDTAEQGNA